MIYSLRGSIVNLRPWELVLEAGGVGYQVKITLEAYEKLKKEIGQTDKNVFFFHTRVIYRENGSMVYGFLSEKEAQLFDFVRSLQGIGPQLSSNLISTLGTKRLLEAIEKADSESLVRVPKVGKNIAEKIIFESAQKKKKLSVIKSSLGALGSNGENRTEHQLWEQLEEALGQLGFQKKELLKAQEKINRVGVKKPPQKIAYVQEWIRLYLNHL